MFTKKTTFDLALSATFGLALLIPFAVLEFVNTDGFATVGFPVSLFFSLWLLSFSFLMGVTGFIRQIRSGVAFASAPLSTVFRAAFMIAIAFMWYSVVSDQMPCFMGVPNCD